MLQSLHVENYALIRHADISFEPRFIVITGETGAGKSILLGALGLLLGQRADSKVLFDANRKCVVEAQFDISTLALESFFDDNDLDYDTTLVIRREVLPSAKSRAFINDTPVSLQELKSLSSRLIDIHSQHQTLTLTDSNFQLSMLDSLAHAAPLLEEYRIIYKHYVSLKKELERLTALDTQNRKEADYNQFLFDELERASLVDGEQEELEKELQLLSHTETIKEHLLETLTLCDSEQPSVLPLLHAAQYALQKATPYHEALKPLSERLDSVSIELRDIVGELESIDGALSFSPERLNEVSQRLDEIYRLEKKHQLQSVADLLNLKEELNEKLQAISSVDESISQVMEQVDQSFAQMQECASRLSECRKVAAPMVAQRLLPLLADLGMANARVVVEVTPTPDYTANGNDEVCIMFNANKGGELRKLQHAASGGELSRLMLAVKSLLADDTLLPTIIFDEIDTGVSGDISMRVGDIMLAMSQQMQVIAITHLPQIAAKATQHLKVYKVEEETEGGERTASHIKPLSPEERRHEVAVMLSSDPPTASALQTAEELMKR